MSKMNRLKKLLKIKCNYLSKILKKVNEEFTLKQNQKKNLGGLLLENEIELKVKTNKEMNVQELMDKGDNILGQDRQGIERMNRVVKSDIELAKEMEKELAEHQIKLDNTSKDLKEMDYSLARARKQLTTMFKMYATDKIIMCLIVIIVLVIIAIIIVAAVGGDTSNSFNVPHDIFSSTKNSTTTTSRILLLP